MSMFYVKTICGNICVFLSWFLNFFATLYSFLLIKYHLSVLDKSYDNVMHLRHLVEKQQKIKIGAVSHKTLRYKIYLHQSVTQRPLTIQMLSAK